MDYFDQWLERVYATSGDRVELDAAHDERAELYNQQLWASANPYLALSCWVFGKHVPDIDARILDAGCGTGNMAQLLHQIGYSNLVGLDPSEGTLRVAERKGMYRELHAMTLGSTVNLPSESFDAVVAAGVLTHGHAPPEAVDRILGVTKPGGTIVFSLSTIAHEAGFADKLDSLEASGAWSKVEQSDLFQTFPFSETEGHLRHWVFANQKA